MVGIVCVLISYSPSTKKKFVLQLELRKELDPAECHWNDASVGRVVLMMKKKERSHWENIIAVRFIHSYFYLSYFLSSIVMGRRMRKFLATCTLGGP